MKRLALVVLQACILAACLYYVLHNLDGSRVLAALSRVSPAKAAAALLLQTMLSIAASPYRLFSLCRREAPFGTMLLASGLGQFLNMLLPAKLGEAAKLVLLGRSLSGGMTQATESVFWERFFDMNAMLLLALASGALMGSFALAGPLALVVAGFWGAVFAIKVWGGLADRLLALLPWPGLAAYLTGVAHALRLRLTPGFALGLALLTLPLWLGEVLVHGLMLGWAFGFDLTMAQLLAVSAVGMAGLSTPATPGSVGVYEAALVAALTAFGQPAEESLAAALLLHVALLTPTLGLGLYAVLRLGFRAALRLGAEAKAPAA